MAQDPVGLLVRNMFNLIGLTNGLTAEARHEIEQAYGQIIAEMAKMDPTELASQVWRRSRVERIMENVSEIAGEASKSVHRVIRARLAEISVQQAKVGAEILKNSLGPIRVGVTTGQIGINLAKKIIDTNPIQGEFLSHAFEGLSDKIISGFRRELQSGMARNEPLGSLVRRIRGSSDGKGGYVGGVMKTTTRGAEAFIRTAVNDISNQAMMDTWGSNDDVVEEYEVLVTLDDRTCLICGPLDGKIFDVGDHEGRPPFHIGCRCVTLPIIKWKELGVDPPGDGTRASMGGQVSSGIDYEDWLSNQSSKVQDSILGPSRAELFRDGKVSLADLVKSDGRILTLAEL